MFGEKLKYLPTKMRLRALAAPALLFVTLFSVTIILYRSSDLTIDSNIIENTQKARERVAELLMADLNSHLRGVRSVSSLLKSDESDSSERTVQSFSRYIMEESWKGLTAIAGLNEYRMPVWVESVDNVVLDDINALLGQDNMKDAIDSIDLTSSRPNDPDRDFVITRPLGFDKFEQEFESGGCAVIYPTFKGDVFLGYVIGIFVYDRLVNALLSEEILDQYYVQLIPLEPAPIGTLLEEGYWEDEEENVWQVAWKRSAPWEGRGLEHEPAPQEKTFRSLGDLGWGVIVAPKEGLLLQSLFFPKYLPSRLILTLGIILSVIFSGMLYRQQALTELSRSEALESRTRLASTSDHLAHTREELALILNNVDEAIVLYDVDLAPLQINAAFQRAFHTASDSEFLSRSQEAHHDYMARRFENDAHYRALLNHLRENPEKPYNDEMVMVPADSSNRLRYFQRHATAVCGPLGKQRGYLVVYHDITPMRIVDRLKEDFLANVTHDLKTPLASIKGFAETMIRDPNMAQETRDEFSTIICNESTRLQEMIEDLLDIRRMEEGKIDLVPETYNLRAIIEEVISFARPILEPRSITVISKWVGDTDGMMNGDARKIGRCVRNILGNAIKYAPANSHIWIRGIESDDRVEVEFTDEGPGIPEEDLPHVFEKFYRGSKHIRRIKGTGLGLAIVKHIVENHGGIVSAENTPGRGATFRIVLPKSFTFPLPNADMAAETNGSYTHAPPTDASQTDDSQTASKP